MSKRPILFVSHRLDLRGGQERSMHEILTRLAEQDYPITVMSFGLENWPEHLPVPRWKAVSGSKIPIQLLKNFWFSIRTFPYLWANRKKFLVITIGTSSWFAHLRVIQFLHRPYHKLIKKGLAPYPNDRGPFHKAYQSAFSMVTIFLEKFLFKKTKYFMAISDRIKDELMSNFSLRNDVKIQISRHAIDLDYDQLEKENGETTRLLFVGALERKGIEKAIRALALISDQDFHFDVVGDGDIKRWSILAKSLGLERKVTFYGVAPSASFFERADVFIFPSTYEPFGLVVSEAVGHGCALLVSQECGAMELWPSIPGEYKIMSTASATEWSDAIKRLIGNKTKCRALAESAYKDFKQHSWKDSADAYDQFIQQIYEGR